MHPGGCPAACPETSEVWTHRLIVVRIAKVWQVHRVWFERLLRITVARSRARRIERKGRLIDD